jgi:tetratricopeptide (TPR) repeat protein
VNEAIALYQESLSLFEQIGNVQGKAAALAMMAQCCRSASGNFETAIVHLQESLQILQHIGSPHAATVEEILADVPSALRSSL